MEAILLGEDEVELGMRGGSQPPGERVREEFIVKDDLLRGFSLCRLMRGLPILVLAPNQVTSFTIAPDSTKDASTAPKKDLRRPSVCGLSGSRPERAFLCRFLPQFSPWPTPDYSPCTCSPA